MREHHDEADETSPRRPDADRPGVVPVVAADEASAAFQRYREHGDRAALEHALQLCAPSLLRAARSQARGDDVEDILQECMVVAIRRAADVQPGMRLLPWLIGILKNKARARQLRRWRRSPSATATAAQEPVSPDPDPASVVGQAQWAGLIAEHVRNLPEQYRAVVESHLLQHEALSAIAARLGVPPSTTRTQFARGLALLRNRLPAPLLAGVIALLAVREAHARPAPSGVRARTGFAVAVLCAAAAVVAAWQASSVPALVPAAKVLQPPVAAAPRAREVPPAIPSRQLAQPAEPTGPVPLRIRLRSLAGEPVSDLPVILDPDFRPGLTVFRAAVGWKVQRSDADGEVRFDWSGRGRAAIRLHDLAVLHVVTSDGARTFDFPVPDPTKVRVSVTDDHGRTVEGARIVVSAAAGGRAPGFDAATTDSVGSAEFVLPTSTCYFWVQSGEHAASRVFPLKIEPAQQTSGRVQVEVKLQPSERVCRGTVLSPTGEPMPGALVAVWSEDLSMPPMLGTTDAAGRFALGAIGPGPGHAAAVAADFAATEASFTKDQSEVVLRLQHPGTLQGRIVGTWAGSPDSLRIVTLRIDSGLWAGLADVGGPVAPDGTFRLSGLAPGRHQAALFAGSSRPAAMAEFEVVANGTTAIDLQLPTAAAHRVRVLDERGRPIEGAVVAAERVQGWAPDECRQEARSDADGVACLYAISGGSRTLSVHAPDGVGVLPWPSVVLPMPVEGDTIDLVVPDAALQLGGIEGQLPAAHLELARRSRLRLRRDSCMQVREVAHTQQGEFRCVRLTPGRYCLEIAGGDTEAGNRIVLARVEVDGGRMNRLDLSALAVPVAVAVHVPAAAATAAVPSRLYDAQGELLEAMSLVAGATVQRQLLPGDYRLLYASASATTETVNFVVKDQPVAITLARDAGKPCRLEAHFDGVNPQSMRLLTTILESGAESGIELLMPETAGGTMHAVDIDLRPGTYELRARLPSGQELRRAFVVAERSGAHVFPFRAP